MNPADLASLRAFLSFEEQEMDSLAALFEQSETREGDFILRSGEADGSLYVLLSGSVDVSRTLPGGGTVTIGSLDQGSIFDILGAMDGGTRAASCVARSQVRCARMSRSSYTALLDSGDVLGLRLQLLLIRHLYRDLRETNRRLASFVDTVDESTEIEDLLDGLSPVN